MSAKPLDATGSSGGWIGIEQLLNLAKVVALLFVELFDLNILSRFVYCTFLALALSLLDLAVDDFPIFRCVVFAKAPFLESTLVLTFAVDGLGAYLNIHASTM